MDLVLGYCSVRCGHGYWPRKRERIYSTIRRVEQQLMHTRVQEMLDELKWMWYWHAAPVQRARRMCREAPTMRTVRHTLHYDCFRFWCFELEGGVPTQSKTTCFVERRIKSDTQKTSTAHILDFNKTSQSVADWCHCTLHKIMKYNYYRTSRFFSYWLTTNV